MVFTTHGYRSRTGPAYRLQSPTYLALKALPDARQALCLLQPVNGCLVGSRQLLEGWEDGLPGNGTGPVPNGHLQGSQQGLADGAASFKPSLHLAQSDQASVPSNEVAMQYRRP